MGFDGLVHVFYAAVADFDRILVEDFVDGVALWWETFVYKSEKQATNISCILHFYWWGETK